MPRLKKDKIVHSPPLFALYKPVGIMRSSLQRLCLTLDEYEAIRLADYLGMDHAEAALEMEISRSTFSRLIEKARQKTARFLIEGKELCIEGGKIHFRDNIIRCFDCGHMFNIDMGKAVSQCPQCHSENLLNLAGGFGHGRCCAERAAQEKNEVHNQKINRNKNRSERKE